jgi:hypothetical protein
MGGVYLWVLRATQLSPNPICFKYLTTYSSWLEALTPWARPMTLSERLGSSSRNRFPQQTIAEVNRTFFTLTNRWMHSSQHLVTWRYKTPELSFIFDLFLGYILLCPHFRFVSWIDTYYYILKALSLLPFFFERKHCFLSHFVSLTYRPMQS